MNNNYNKYFTETDAGLNIEANNINANCITSQTNKFSLDSEGNLTVNSINFNTSENNLLSFEAIFNKIYPVGAIYISTSDVNPGTLFVGSWARINSRFLIGAGPNEENTFNGFGTYPTGSYNFTPGELGGEAVHTLTVNEMPSHNHMYIRNKILDSEPTSEGGTTRGSNSLVNNMKTYAYTNPTGGNWAHNNIPPYYVVYMWKRIS